jgi:Holliday junction resolvasome RuvABC endonuclease subunit
MVYGFNENATDKLSIMPASAIQRTKHRTGLVINAWLHLAADMEGTMITLGLDMATKTGWCFASNNKIVGRVGKSTIIESGVQDFAKRRGEGNGLLFMRFRKWLIDLCETLKPDLIVYERAHFRGGAATELCVGMQTRAQELAAEIGVESAPVPTGTLKKWATGKGNAGKEQMMEMASVYLGREPIDDNEADAALLALYGLARFL